MKLLSTLVFIMMMTIIFMACAYSGDDTCSDDESPKLSKPIFSEAYVDRVFHDWMLKHGRTYFNSSEMKRRREIFKKELEYIKMWNDDDTRGSQIGLNQFSDYDYTTGEGGGSCADDFEYRKI